MSRATYSVRGPITISGVSAPVMVVLFILNIGLSALGIMIVGALLHMGWNLI